MPDIQVTKQNPNTGVISMGMTANPKILSGLDLLVQLVALSLLKNPGRDVFDRTEGSGLRNLIGQYNLADPEEIKLVVVQQVRAVEQELFVRQVVGVGTPEERLKKLTVLDVAANDVGNSLLIRIQVVNEAGDQRDILV